MSNDPKTILPACNVSINSIFMQLHETAKEAAQKVQPDYNIENSAIEGKDGSFYGAGTHIILASPAKEGGKCVKSEAFKAIQTYVQWFSGPDISKNLSEDDLWPFEGEKTKQEKKEDKSKKPDKVKPEDSDDKDEDSENAGESQAYIPSFKQFLLSEDTKEKNSAESGKQQDGKEQSSSEKQDTDEENAQGYFIKYKIHVKGQPEKTFSDTIKKFTSELIQSLGFQRIDWGSGAVKGDFKLGNLNNKLKDVFGKLDPNKVKAAYDGQPLMKSSDAVSSVLYTKQVKLHCKKWLSSSDQSKLKDAELAVCTRISKTDPTYKLFNPQAVADMLTKSISGLFKQFKNRVSPKDVILVNNYSDNVKRNKEKFQRSDGIESTVADSIQANSIVLNAINEDSSDADNADSSSSKENARKEDNTDSKSSETDKIQKALGTAKDILADTAKQILGESYLESDVGASEDIIQMLNKSTDITEKAESALSNKKWLYLIKTKTVVDVKAENPASGSNDEKSTKKKASESLECKYIADALAAQLFEDTSANYSSEVQNKIDSLEKKVKTTFSNTIFKIGKLQGNTSPDDSVVEKAIMKFAVIDKPTESVDIQPIMNALFEDVLFSNEADSSDDSQKSRSEDTLQSKSVTLVYYWVVPEENNFIEKKDSADKGFDHTDYDFYIVPMPGLSWNANKRYDASTQTIKDQ